MTAMASKKTPSSERKVIIVGAGCTGCALAQGLKKLGIPSVIYEARSSSGATREWDMGLHWAFPVLEQLLPSEIFTRFQSVQVDPSYPVDHLETLRFQNGATAEIMNSFSMKNLYRVHRNRLRSLLAESLDIRERTALETISYSPDQQTVTAHLSDGTTDTSIFLIGADGPKSSVRNILLGSEAAKITTMDYASTMCYTTYSRSQALTLRSPPHHPLWQSAPHPAGFSSALGLHNAPDPEKPENWVFFHYISFPEPASLINTKTKTEHALHQKELAAQFADPIRSAFEWMPKDNERVWYGKLNYWDPGEKGHRWDNYQGRITLAGDAAHPMTFHRGQGLNHALTDSLRLCEAIQKVWQGNNGFDDQELSTVEDRETAISSYEEEMIARGGEEVRVSAMNTAMLHDWKKVVQSPFMKRGVQAVEVPRKENS